MKESIVLSQKTCKIKDDDIEKKRERTRKAKSPDRQRKNLREASETVWCEEKMLSAR